MSCTFVLCGVNVSLFEVVLDGRSAEKVARDADVDFMVEIGGELERMTARECVEVACESRARREWERSAVRCASKVYWSEGVEAVSAKRMHFGSACSSKFFVTIY